MNKSNLILASVLAIIFTSILIIFSPTSQKTSLSSPAPSPISTESVSPTPDWKTYENKEYGFSFKYPTVLKISENIQPNFTQISIENIVYIEAQKNYPINQPNYYLDSESNGERNIGNINWKTFYLKDGYSDGGIISNIPIYALQIEKDKILYAISGFTSSVLTDQQLQILSTFKFIPSVNPTKSATSSASTLRSQVEDWKTYTKSSSNLSWDKCEGESTASANLKNTVSKNPIFTKTIDGVKLAYSLKSDFTAEDIGKFVMCQAGGEYPIKIIEDKILWVSACSTGIAPDNPKCENTLTAIKKLYGYVK